MKLRILSSYRAGARFYDFRVDMVAVAEKKSRGPAEGDVRMTFDMPGDLRQRLKVVAAQHGKLMKDLILDWVRRGVEELEHRKPKH